MSSVITNPRALIWPDQRICFAVAETATRTRKVMDFSIGVLNVLRRCVIPVSLEYVEKMIDQVEAPITVPDLLQVGLLTPSGDANQLNAWRGLRIGDCGMDFKPYGTLEPMVREREISGLPLFIMDNFVEPDCIDSLAAWFSTQSFSLADIDREETSYSKHWVKKLDANPARLTAIPLVGWMDAACRSQFPSFELELVEAKAYNTLYGDMPTYHSDSEIGPTVTALLFSHRKWELNWGGELIICDSAGEPCSAVSPLPGRIVFFRGDLLHKAGSPSRLAFDSRQTIVLRYEVQYRSNSVNT